MEDFFFRFGDLALFLLRVMVAVIFAASGWKDVSDSESRSKRVGLSKGFTIFLGLAEIAGALSLVTGILYSWAAIGLILIMLGAIYMKAVVWKKGFWGEGGQGWHYDLMLLVMNLVILTVGAGDFAIRWPHWSR